MSNTTVNQIINISKDRDRLAKLYHNKMHFIIHSKYGGLFGHIVVNGNDYIRVKCITKFKHKASTYFPGEIAVLSKNKLNRINKQNLIVL